VIHLDANFLIQAMVPGSDSEAKLLGWLKTGEPISMSSIAWGEFLSGPLTDKDRELAARLLSPPEPFLPADAEFASKLFNKTGRRSKTMPDCQIAAVAIRLNAAIATANRFDFEPFLPFGARLL
jgi:predicted nucleic acid-binding protein